MTSIGSRVRPLAARALSLALLAATLCLAGPVAQASADSEVYVGTANGAPAVFVTEHGDEANRISIYDCGSGGVAAICVYDRNDATEAYTNDPRCYDDIDLTDPNTHEDNLDQNSTVRCPGLGQIVVNTGSEGDQIELSNSISPMPAPFNTRAAKYQRAYLHGGTNTDTINGGLFRDYIYGELGNDTLRGSNGDDELRGQGGGDAMEGGPDADLMDGGSNDEMARPDYVDYAPKSAGVNVTEDNVANDGNTEDHQADNVANVQMIEGTRFNDTLTGGPEGNNQLRGEDGSDTLSAPQSRLNGPSTVDGGHDEFVGGPGTNDLVSYEQQNVILPSPCGTNLFVTLDDQFNDGVGGYENDNVRPDVERITGASSLPNVITGSALDNELRGGACKDVLNGAGGNDAMAGYHDKDRFIGGSGRDRVDYYYSEFGVKVTPATDGQYDDGPNGSEDYVEGDVEDVEGSNHNDELTGTAAANRLVGHDGRDKLVGLAGPDELDGGPGYNDVADYSYSPDGVTVTVGDGQANDGVPSEGDNVTSGTDDVIGTNSRDTLTGDDATNHLYGRDGTDVLDGAGGGDTLEPNTLANGTDDRWKDYAYGRAGNDVIHVRDCIPELDRFARPSCSVATEDHVQCGADTDSVLYDRGVDTFEDETLCEAKSEPAPYRNMGNLPPINPADPVLQVGGTSWRLDVVDGNGATHDNQLIVETNATGPGDTNPTVSITDLTGGIEPAGFGPLDCDVQNFGHTLMCRGVTELNIDLGGGSNRLLLVANRFGLGVPTTTHIKGGEEDDAIRPEWDSDVTIEGGGGADTIYSPPGRQHLFGGTQGRASATGDRDVVSYEGRTDQLDVNLVRTGGNGAPGEDDQLVGFTNVIGGDGADHLAGDANSNNIEGRGGDDTLDPGQDQVVDQLDGGANTDSLDVVSHLGGVDIEIPSRSRDKGSPGWDSMVAMERFNGSNGNDRITGTAAGETLRGLDGDDAIDALGGEDTVIGGLNSDTINGGAGVDTAGYEERSAGVSVDLATAGAAPNETGLGGNSQDVSVTHATLGGDRDYLAGIQNVNGGIGNDNLSGNAQSNAFKGNLGDDTFNGRGGAENFSPETGRDTYFGGADTDTMLYGNRDYSTRSPKPSVRVTAGDGFANDGEDADRNGSAEEADNIGPDIEVINGNAGDDTLDGSDNADILIGGAGNDTIHGLGGVDFLTDDQNGASGGNNDKLYGGKGNDTLSGGIGFDSYWGDDDNDRIYAKDGRLAEPVRCGFGTDDYADIDLNAPDADGDLFPDQDCERSNFKGWSWKKWSPVPNTDAASNVSVASRGLGMLDAFYQGPDKVIRWVPNHGGGWFNLGSTLMASHLGPGSVGLNGTVDLLAIGLYDNHLYHQANNCFFCGWSKVGSGELTDAAGNARPRTGANNNEVGLISAPRAVAEPGSNQYAVYVRGSDSKIWILPGCTATSSRCSGEWGLLGTDQLSGAPALTWQDNRLYLFSKDVTSKRLRYRVGSMAFGWSSWIDLGPLPGDAFGTAGFGGSPAVARLGTSSVEIFFADDRRLVYHASLKNGSMSAWDVQGGPASADPDATSWGLGRVDVISSKGANNQLHRYYFNGEG